MLARTHGVRAPKMVGRNTHHPCKAHDGIASAGATVCCAKSCQVCEQQGCQRRGADHCCVDAIHLAGVACDHGVQAPCVRALAVVDASLRHLPSAQASEYAVAADAARAPSASSSNAFLPPIPCREDLPFVAERHFFRTGRAAEVGVFRGVLSQHNLRVWTGDYYAIDAWAFRPAEGRTDNWDQATQEANLAHARRNTRFAGSRVHLVRNRSVNAARTFPDAFFDWIYIDALHTRRAVLADVHAWYPQAAPGRLAVGRRLRRFVGHGLSFRGPLATGLRVRCAGLKVGHRVCAAPVCRSARPAAVGHVDAAVGPHRGRALPRSQWQHHDLLRPPERLGPLVGLLPVPRVVPGKAVLGVFNQTTLKSPSAPSACPWRGAGPARPCESARD